MSNFHNRAVFQTPSAHHDERRNGARPRFLILHYTGTRTGEAAADVYLGRTVDPGGRVSPHYMIDTDGRVFQFVCESRRAWHAGVSYWRGLEDLNSLSIGIEIVNEGETGGYPPFLPAQMNSLIPLCRDILQRHDIPPENILGHSDIAPMRRLDPGPALDWAALAAAGVGLWPMPEDSDRAAAPEILQDMTGALHACGYDPQADPGVLLRAFRSHFHPEAMENFSPETRLESAARLAWLLARLRDKIPPDRF
ncbi:MAG: N-acetylmuramoyl-L-alanine amidase [Rhodospirillales bacterium]|nr:N-acetylmuramoyl-L-alanine amidase [Rhodospirillales bacterium]